MGNRDGTLWMVFNGEIYNYRALRRTLEHRGHRFLSQTDTEVVLRLYEERGPLLLEDLDGMFAFVVYDATRRCLFGARDRLGKKPLYYALSGQGLGFASEPKALLALPHVSREPNFDALPQYLAFNCVPGPATLHRDIHKLEPGTWFQLNAHADFSQRRYWVPGPASPAGDPRDPGLVEEARTCLATAVEKRLMSDVPLGAMLSGGLDSSLVVALMAKASGRPVSTFTVAYPGDETDADSDPSYARGVARTFGTEHHEVLLRDEHIAAVLDDLPGLADDPIGAPSVAANILLGRFVRSNGVKVALVGEGADEVFCGYGVTQRLWRLHERLAVFSRLVPRRAAGWVSRGLRPLLDLGGDPSLVGSLDCTIDEQLTRYSRGEHQYRGYGALFTGRGQQRLFGDRTPGASPYLSLRRRLDLVPGFARCSYLDQLAVIDVLLGLPERLLMRVDRACMLSGVEARAPFLDVRVLDMAWRVPPQRRARRPKAFLKELAMEELPPAVVRRRKRGFPTAQRVFLAPAVFRRIRAAVSDAPFLDALGFDAREVTRMLDTVDQSRSRFFYHIWSLYILSLWFQCWVRGDAPSCSGVEEAGGGAQGVRERG